MIKNMERDDITSLFTEVDQKEQMNLSGGLKIDFDAPDIDINIGGSAFAFSGDGNATAKGGKAG
jgi:hypothetical protein